MEKHGLIFITGGARSGKSTFAEQYAVRYAQEADGYLCYLATSEPEDTEMQQRITLHQRQREKQNWKTIECPIYIASIVDRVSEQDIVLLDCLTVLLTNELFSSNLSENDWASTDYQQAVSKHILTDILRIQFKAQALIIVSNEVLNEPLSNNAMVNVYSKILGQLHQYLVKNANEAYVIESGIPIMMKGERTK